MTTETSTAAGVTVPGSRLVREATELVRDTASDTVYHHCRRVFFLGTLRGLSHGLYADPELLYVGAMFHDLGLTHRHRHSQQRFELDGADDARSFLQRHGVAAQDAQLVWEGIALHTTPHIPWRMAPEVALVTAGVEADVLGMGLDEVPPDALAEIVALHPRCGFKQGMLKEFADGTAHRPHTAFGNVTADVLERYAPGWVRPNFVDTVLNSHWSE
ncbi:HD domain-containing protein [Streptomyces sp. AF1A]|uniref:HD domain-containing protein n=1 Tax=Streptomyces sp. AF1A TaxID=3394350 RepID=UPI0039BD0FF4